MTQVSLEFIMSLFSKPRMYKYLNESDTPQTLLNKYHSNIILSESMIPALHYLEIILRNQLDNVIRKQYGENWLIKPATNLMISNKDLNKIYKIINKIKREKRREASHDNVLSQMNFGFWCSFFHKRYDPVLWHRKKALKTLLPYLPRRKRTRYYIEKKILIIKNTRNRIAHHESILNNTTSIHEVHNYCCELIEAVSPNALALLSMIDRFPNVFPANMPASNISMISQDLTRNFTR